MRVLIVGGGIGGLTLAAALQQRGIEARVVERTPRFSPVGAGIVLGVNAMKVMSQIGVAEAIAARGIEVGVARVADFRGRTLTALDFQALPRDVGRAIAIHRAALHEAILTGVRSDSIRLGTTVAELTQETDGVRVQFSDGASDTFHLVVGADGIRSSVREMVFGNFPLQYSGYTCWRFVVEAPLPNADTWEMWGPGRRFGVVPIGQGKVYCFTTLNATQNDPAMRDLPLERFKELFGNFGEPVPTVLKQLETASELIWNDLEEIILPTWVRGRVVLLGDAAHAMTPNMGQGAAMAIEDAYVLAELTGQMYDTSAALTKYEQRRRPRVSVIQTRSRRIGRVAQWQSPTAAAIRNKLVSLTPGRMVRRGVEDLARFQP